MQRWTRSTLHTGVLAASGLVLVAVGACETSGDDNASRSELVRVEPVEPGAQCEAGGQVIRTGPDRDGDGEFDGDGIIERFVCNGSAGDPGQDGSSTLIQTEEVPAGDACPAGGLSVRTGVDTNGDGALNDNEVVATALVCSGDGGGAAGRAALIALEDVDPGQDCPNGGVRVQSGNDTDGDGALGAGEVQATRYVCDGEDGQGSGGGALVRATHAPWGEPCRRGGVRIDTGDDANNDGDLDDDEIDATQHVCNLYPLRVEAGESTSCALVSNGTVRCWGLLPHPDLGATPIPSPVPGLDGARTLTVGSNHACALLDNGSARCWGQNASGQLGDGTTVSTPEPVATTGVATFAQLDAGRDHTCGVIEDGFVYCWGDNTHGQLGTAPSAANPTPTFVPGLTGAVEVAAAYYHSCARLNNGTVRCWGQNANGQLGDGTTQERTAPVEVFGLSGAIEIEANGAHTCALLGNGTLRCWGLNNAEQLGYATNQPFSIDAGLVENLDSTPTHITLGGNHTCARLTNGASVCWGDNTSGQLALPLNTVQTRFPSAINSLTRFTQLSAGFSHTCALGTDHAIACWGDNSLNQLGLSGQPRVATPTFIPWDLAP